MSRPLLAVHALFTIVESCARVLHGAYQVIAFDPLMLQRAFKTKLNIQVEC